MKKVIIIYVLLISVFLLPAVAKNSEGEVEEVRVTAPAVTSAEEVSETGERVSVVGSDQIADLAAQDVVNAARRVPGVLISRYNMVGSYGGGQGGTLFIRGMGADRPGGEVLMLLDGVPRFTGIWTHPLMDMFSVDYIGEMRFYKGAQPLLFGSGAFAAVNIVPYFVSEGFETRIGAAYGSYNTYVGKFGHGGRLGNFDYFFSAGVRESEGHRENANGMVFHSFGKVGYQINSHWYVYGWLDFADAWARDPGLEGSSPPPSGKYNTLATAGLFRVRHKYDKVEGELSVWMDDGHMEWNQWDSSLKIPYDYLMDYFNWGIRAEEKLHFWKGSTITLGYDHMVYGGDGVEEDSVPAHNFDYGEKYFWESSPYFAVAQTFVVGSPEFSITPSAGAKYVQTRHYGDFWAPKFGLVVKHLGSTLHFSYGIGYNVPGVFAVHNAQRWSYTSKKFVYWKALNPEFMEHYEAGVMHEVSDWLVIDVTWFHDVGRDRLIFVAPPPPPPHFENLASWETQGVEGVAKIQPTKRLDFYGGVTVINTKPIDAPIAPNLMATVAVNWEVIPNLILHLDSQYVGERYNYNPRYESAPPEKLDEFVLVNGKLEYILKLGAGGYEASIWASGENINGAKYEYRVGYPMPRDTYLFGIDVRM